MIKLEIYFKEDIDYDLYVKQIKKKSKKSSKKVSTNNYRIISKENIKAVVKKEYKKPSILGQKQSSYWTEEEQLLVYKQELTYKKEDLKGWELEQFNKH